MTVLVHLFHSLCVCKVSDKTDRPLWNYSSWYWGTFFPDTVCILECNNLQVCWCFCIGRLQRKYHIRIDTGDTFHVHSKKHCVDDDDDYSDSNVIVCVWQGTVTHDTIANMLLVQWWALHMNLISNGRLCHPQNRNCITHCSVAKK